MLYVGNFRVPAQDMSAKATQRMNCVIICFRCKMRVLGSLPEKRQHRDGEEHKCGCISIKEFIEYKRVMKYIYQNYDTRLYINDKAMYCTTASGTVNARANTMN